MDDVQLFDRQIEGLRHFYEVFARASPGARIVETGGVQACLTPRAPNRSVANAVVYRDPTGLETELDRLGQLYAETGVKAWTVWVPARDTHTAARLGRAGHVLDADPEAMGIELEALADLDGSDDDIVEGIDPSLVGMLNDLAYYSERGEFERALTTAPAGLHLYGAIVDGECVSCLSATDHDSDCAIFFVATLASARGRGLATRLMRRALRDARDRGCTTTTLQATRAGYPIYRRLGYRDLGAMQMWERRDGDGH
jgi:GNAT superfamily N-acetyltransferase